MYSKALTATCAIVGSLIAMTSVASADKMTMKVTLNSAAEVPPNSSTATGTADVTFDTASRQLTWKVTYSGLTGPATMAHFHGPAEPGKNAPVVVPIPNPASGADGSATLTEAQAEALIAGKYYINIHTAANKGGEIRGQVAK